MSAQSKGLSVVPIWLPTRGHFAEAAVTDWVMRTGSPVVKLALLLRSAGAKRSEIDWRNLRRNQDFIDAEVDENGR
jgi:hypothetical protein